MSCNHFRILSRVSSNLYHIYSSSLLRAAGTRPRKKYPLRFADLRVDVEIPKRAPFSTNVYIDFFSEEEC